MCTPVNYNSGLRQLVETIMVVRVPRERTVTAGRPTYSVNATGLAEMRRAIGFGPQRQRFIQIQSDLIELLDLTLRDAMSNSPHCSRTDNMATLVPSGYSLTSTLTSHWHKCSSYSPPTTLN